MTKSKNSKSTSQKTSSLKVRTVIKAGGFGSGNHCRKLEG
jgi:hypothetical protein